MEIVHMAVNASLDLASSDLNEQFVWVGNFEAESWYPKFDVFHCVDELIFNNKEPSLIVISLPAEAQDEALQALRSRNHLSHSLIFVCHESALSPFLANEIWGTDYDLQYQAYLIRKRRLNLDYQDDNDLKLISYLWLHGNRALAPHAVPSEKQLYDYPLLKAWQFRSEESFQLLNQLTKRNWLQVEQVFNKIRYCPFCFSGHVNHLEVCPQCESVDLATIDLIHCKKCDHTGFKDNFRNNGAFICPCCESTLEEKDFSIPEERNECQCCKQRFKSTETKVQCLHCQSMYSFNVPDVQKVCSYSLAPTGKTIVHYGHQYKQIEFSLGKSIPALQFYWLLKWQNDLAKRHKLQHTLLSVSIENLDTLLQANGELIGLTIMDKLQKQLKSIMRKTDACSHYTEGSLLLFLPFTNQNSLKFIKRRLSDLQPVDENEQIKLSIKAILLPDELGNDVLGWIRKRLLEGKSESNE